MILKAPFDYMGFPAVFMVLERLFQNTFFSRVLLILGSLGSQGGAHGTLGLMGPWAPWDCIGKPILASGFGLVIGRSGVFGAFWGLLMSFGGLLGVS